MQKRHATHLQILYVRCKSISGVGAPGSNTGLKPQKSAVASDLSYTYTPSSKLEVNVADDEHGECQHRQLCTSNRCGKGLSGWFLNV
jgi:hypothetical protein